jgi:hypothetical protein
MSSSQGIQRSSARYCSFSLKILVYLLILCLFIYNSSVANIKRIADATSLQLLPISALSSFHPSILHLPVADGVIDADIYTKMTATTFDHSLKNASSGQQTVHKRLHEDDETPVCRVVLENKMDYHYEIIESTILQFPLPWEKLGCNVTTAARGAGSSKKRPIVTFDVALADHHTFGNEKEGWMDYFTTSLKG